MSPRLAEKLLTAEEFATMPESQYAELVRGRIVETPVNNWTHAELMVRLSMLLASFALSRRLGKVYCGDPGMVVERDPDTARGPDVAFVTAARVPQVPAAGFWEQVCDLAVEILSPDNTLADVQVKVKEYLNAGVRLVWVVDPVGRTIGEYRVLGAARVLAAGDVLDGADVLPGFRFPVSDVFDPDKVPMIASGGLGDQR
jgi:Uma2 family endonuclease